MVKKFHKKDEASFDTPFMIENNAEILKNISGVLLDLPAHQSSLILIPYGPVGVIRFILFVLRKEFQAKKENYYRISYSYVILESLDGVLLFNFLLRVINMNP